MKTLIRFRHKHYFKLVLKINLLLLISLNLSAQNVYVSNSGNNSNNGTINSPWKTIQYAVDHVNPGQNIYVRGGVYSEKVKFSGNTDSGSSNNGYVSLQNYSGETVVIDGSSLSPNDREGLISIINASYIKIIGFELKNFKTGSNSNTPVGIYIEGASNHIEIRDNKIHDIVSTGSDGGAHGIGIFGTDAANAVYSLTIDNNEIYNCTLRWSEAMVLNGNVRNFIVSNNSVHDCDNIAYDFIGFENECASCGTSDPNNLDQARDGEVYSNIAYNIDTKDNPVYNNDRSAAGFYVDGGKNIIFDGNISHHCNLGFELASEHKGKSTSDIIVRNNFIYLNQVLGITTGGYANNKGSADNCKIINNTFYKNNTSTRSEDDWGAEILLQSNNHNNIYKNNIVYAKNNRPRIIQGNSTNTGNVFDYNIYYGSTSGTAPGSHSITANPQLTAPGNGDLHIANSSPAINAGENLGVDIIGDVDIDGQIRVYENIVDIGADESINTGDTVSTINAPSSLVATAQNDNQINLSWQDNANNEEYFILEKSENDINNWTQIANISANISSYSDTGLTANTTYYYRIKAVNASNSSDWSNIANATTQDITQGSWTTISNNNFETGWGIWNDGGADARRYGKGKYAHQGTYCLAIQDNTMTSVITTDALDLSSYSKIRIEFWFKAISMDNPNEDFWLQVSTNGGNSYTTVRKWAEETDFENNVFYKETEDIDWLNFTNNTKIRFRCDASGNGDDVYIDEIVILGFSTDNPDIPASPSNLSANAISSNQINLSWNDNSNNEDNFEIQQSLNGTNNWSQIAVISANSNSYQDTGISENTTYFYRVRAINSVGSSAWSNVIDATTMAANTTPSIIIDGDASDWGNITALATADNQNIQSIKVTNDDTKLFVLLEGSGIAKHTEIFINSDNNKNTGYLSTRWTSSGADYMIEDNELYKSTNNGTGWNWSYKGTAGINYVKNSSVVELSINKSKINPSSTITIGAVDLNSNWNIVSIIPIQGDMLTYNFNNFKVGISTLSKNSKTLKTDEISVTAYPNPFSGLLNIKYNLLEADDVYLIVYDISGNIVSKKMCINKQAGFNSIIWNASDLPNGVYTISLKTNTFHKFIKVLLAR